MIDIFDLLLQNKIIGLTTSKMVKNFCLKWNISGYHGFLETNVFEESELADILSNIMKIDRVYDIFCPQADHDIYKKIGYLEARKRECFPRIITDAHWTEIILADPTQRENIATLRTKINKELHFSIATRSDILLAIDKYYPIEEQLNLSNKEESLT